MWILRADLHEGFYPNGIRHKELADAAPAMSQTSGLLAQSLEQVQDL